MSIRLAFLILSFALVCAALGAILHAPADATLGIIQKIFYFHVSSAFAMLLCLAGGSLASLVDLVSPSDRLDAWARALLETGVLFAAMVLTSGPLWARKSWGMYWTWEPRLTLTLLALLLAVAVVAVRAAAGEAGRRISAAMAVLAGPTTYLIHVAVQRWGGTHPQVIRGGGIQHPAMQLAFGLSVAALLSLAAVLASARFRGIRLSQQLASLQLDVSARELRRSRGKA